MILDTKNRKPKHGPTLPWVIRYAALQRPRGLSVSALSDTAHCGPPPSSSCPPHEIPNTPPTYLAIFLKPDPPPVPSTTHLMPPPQEDTPKSTRQREVVVERWTLLSWMRFYHCSRGHFPPPQIRPRYLLCSMRRMRFLLFIRSC